MKKIAIVQSNYIPWKGYFDLIAAVDEFVLYDDMQYTRRDWRNRNKIKTPQGAKWLTVPVKVKGNYSQTIRETEIVGSDWMRKHWKALTFNYAAAEHFAEIANLLEPLYCKEKYRYLSDLNRALIEVICSYLGIRTVITSSSKYKLSSEKTQRLVDCCLQAGGTEYVSGPSAKAYMDEKAFTDKGIKLTWFDYEGYPSYPQLWGEFTHHVSILDLLFNCGHETSMMMRFIGATAAPKPAKLC